MTRDRHPELHHDAGDAADRRGHLRAAGARPDRLCGAAADRDAGSRSLGPVPWIVIVAALFLLVGHLVLTYTRFGRYVYMTGGNREAAEYSGVNVRAILPR